MGYFGTKPTDSGHSELVCRQADLFQNLQTGYVPKNDDPIRQLMDRTTYTVLPQWDALGISLL